MARNNYYSNNYSPHFFLDGNIDAGYNTGTWESRINTELASASPLEIHIDGEFEPSSRSGVANIRIIATDVISYSSLKVRIAIMESNIRRSSPNGTQVHNQTFRDMTPSTSGIALTIAEGDTVEITRNYSTPNPLVLANTEIVVFVQSDAGHRILQGAKRKVMDMSYFLEPFALIEPADNDTLPTCTPEFSWHPSVDLDSGYAVTYQVMVNFTDDFTAPFIISEALSETTWTSPICVPDSTNYYWKVVASNGHADDRDCDSVYIFRVEEFEYACDYTSGDVNNNGAFNGIDVSFSVGYFKGGNPPPYSCECIPGNSWFVAGDVNGNCQFNGIDVSYMVAYFKGGPAPVPCPSCPPAP